jgi:3-hydroxyisobutyrate dehydrogenase
VTAANEQRATPTKLGFVGLGSLGAHLAASLLRAGFEVTICDLEPPRATRLLEAGAAWAGTPREAAAASDTLLTCLPSPAAVATVLEGPEGVLSSLRPGCTWIDTSTNDRHELVRLAALAAEHGIEVLEAPVTGGVHLASTGELTVIVGGDATVFERHRPVLDAVGGRVFHVGPLGSAMTLKVITNLLAFVHLVAAGEALMLARAAGLDLARAFEVIRASSGSSFVMETEGQLILNGSYDIGFTLDLAVKDLGFACGLGKELGVPLELGELVERTFVRARTVYGGETWSTAVVRLLEDAVGKDLRAPGFPARLGDPEQKR